MSQETERPTIEAEVTVKFRVTATLGPCPISNDGELGVEKVEKVASGIVVTHIAVECEPGVAGVSVGDSCPPSALHIQLAKSVCHMMERLDKPEDGPPDTVLVELGVAGANLPAHRFNLRSSNVSSNPTTPSHRVSKPSPRNHGPKNKGKKSKNAQKRENKKKRKEMALRFDDPKFANIAERIGMAEALEYRGWLDQKKMKARLHRAAKRRWKGIGPEATEEAKLEAITKEFESFKAAA